ncbi:hypothetical protein D3880_20770 [Pseudomonas cavernae]|uniref:Uncharacterized protein n=1 Tax=Pseudomonas cavernae TaxID=2320867 RepID=A0A385Z7Z0_9PSED|nr:hypothetical protein [Pseudomonas cavernae]AYC34660.1 hypothetical protein D3880_20770 [Pseudomonas cavernae]
MHGSALEDGRHSTPEDPRPQLRWRFLAALALLGLLVGLMLGRLSSPEPVSLERVEVQAGGLVLWFNREAQVHGEHVQGALLLRIDAEGEARRGQLQLNGKAVNWRVGRGAQGLLLNLVAARPLRGEWHGATADGRWRLTISLRAE